MKFFAFSFIGISLFSLCYGAENIVRKKIRPQPILRQVAAAGDPQAAPGALRTPYVHHKDKPSDVFSDDDSLTESDAAVREAPLQLIPIINAEEILRILGGDIQCHAFILDLDGTTFGFEGLLDHSLPGILQTIAERGCYIMVATAEIPL